MRGGEKHQFYWEMCKSFLALKKNVTVCSKSRLGEPSVVLINDLNT